MTNLTERMRLKDRIVSNVAKGIKSIQECQLYRRDGELVLTNTDYPCHKLCEHLDHALLHGLRHISHGYWKVVVEFTRKEAVREIKRLKHVSTDLGKGRAWMFMALNEGLLESYMRCFQENTNIVKKYYVREALVLDHQRLNVLVTLTSGLDFAQFLMDYDVPYLDLSSRPPKSKSQSNDDQVSLCSMDSLTSNRSRNTSICTSEVAKDFQSFSNQSRFRSYTDSDTASTISQDQDCPILHTDLHTVHSGSVDSGCHVGSHSHKSSSLVNTPDNQSTSSNSSYVDTTSRMKRLENVVKLTPDDGNDNTGLEVIRMKGHKTKRKKSKKHMNQSVQVQSEMTLTWSNHSVERSKSERLNNDNSESDEVSVNSIDRKYSPLTLQSPPEGVDSDASKVSLVTNKIEVISEKTSYGQDANIIDMNQSSNKICEGEVEQKMNRPIVLSPLLQGKENCTHNEDMYCHSMEQNLDMDISVDNIDGTLLNSDGKHNANENEVSDTSFEKIENDNVSDQDIVQGSSPGGIVTRRKSSSSLLNERVNFILSQPASNFQCIFVEDEDENEEQDEEDPNEDEEQIEDDGSMKVDNNTLLYLMLDVFGDSEEQLLKMYGCRLGHTEGEDKIVFAVVTNKHLYLLQQKHSDHRFLVDSVISFTELDFISVSNLMTVIQSLLPIMHSFLMETTLKWLLFLEVLTMIFQHVFSIFMHSIYIIQASDIEIFGYSLIHWQDSIVKDFSPDVEYREGHLLWRTDTSMFLGGYTWKPTYVVLRDGLLCLFNNKNDNSEVSDWLLSLCQAVSEGKQKQSGRPGCIPCCLVLTQQKIIMCHEDVQTSFFRTLGSAEVLDITAMLVDSTVKTYFLLEFESQEENVTSEKWILYFNSEKEATRFTKALSVQWSQCFQTDVPIMPIEDFSLQKRCQDMASHLAKALEVRV
ncbi:hypothetical protein ScPMuIL_009539 [Solemya velum]